MDKRVVEKRVQDRENALGTESMRGLERWQVMRSMDELGDEASGRDGHFARRDLVAGHRPLIGVYQPEGFTLFQKMLSEIRREVTSALFGCEKLKIW